MYNDASKSLRVWLWLGCFFVCMPLMYAQHSKSQAVNTRFALEYLQKAVRFYDSAAYPDALACIEAGKSYDQAFADFFYVEALCLMELHHTRAVSVHAAEQAVLHGYRWQFFNEEDAYTLLGRLYVETGRFQEALQLLEPLVYPSADNDLYMATALYGLGRGEKAQAIIDGALDRWSFDVRFPKLFFLQERKRQKTAGSKKLAQAIIKRLYTWLDKDPSLAVYACPYDSNPRENTRRLKVYRNMHAARIIEDKVVQSDIYTQLAAILAELRFGVIDEQTAVQEFFAVKAHGYEPFLQGKGAAPVFFAEHILELSSLVGSAAARQHIAEQLNAFDGIVFDDDNGDTLINTAVLYDQGRPVSAFFDPNQDGVADYEVECSFGTPVSITSRKNGFTFLYDTYPAVREVVQQHERKRYTLIPLALHWEPIELYDLMLRLKTSADDAQSFFTLRLKPKFPLRNEHDVALAALYAEMPDPFDNENMQRIHFDKGMVLSVETYKGKTLMASTRYKNGIMRQKRRDSDGDGFFELLEEYSAKGVLEKISIDVNKNNVFEYYELYQPDQTVVKTWDENEDGIPDIQYTQTHSGIDKVVWKHHYTGKQIVINLKQGQPETLLIDATVFPIIKEPSYAVYWLEKRPPFSASISASLENIFNNYYPEMNSYAASVGAYEIFALKSGGLIYVQVFSKKGDN
ncbi:MAG: hypothetical protein ACTTJ7_08270 [Treponema sp.]